MNPRIWRGLALAFALLLGAGTTPLRAQVVTYQVTGSFTNVPGETLGIMSAPTAFSGTFTVNLALNTSTAVALAGNSFASGFPGYTAVHDLFGFSASSLVSLNFTTGTRTWTKADLDPQSGMADFWASSDLTTAPQYVAIGFYLEDGSDEFSFSVGRVSGDGLTGLLSLDSTLLLSDGATGNDALGTYTVSAVAVPEPSTYAVIAGACALVGAVVWRRKSKSCAVANEG